MNLTDKIVEHLKANKTHQAPQCIICSTPNPQLDQGTMICNKCEKRVSLKAYCFICQAPIYAEKTDDIDCLYQDDLTIPVGRPICRGCCELIRPTRENHLNCLKKKYSALYRGQELRLKEEYVPKKVGLEVWM